MANGGLLRKNEAENLGNEAPETTGAISPSNTEQTAQLEQRLEPSKEWLEREAKKTDVSRLENDGTSSSWKAYKETRADGQSLYFLENSNEERYAVLTEAEWQEEQELRDATKKFEGGKTWDLITSLVTEVGEGQKVEHAALQEYLEKNKGRILEYAALTAKIEKMSELQAAVNVKGELRKMASTGTLEKGAFEIDYQKLATSVSVFAKDYLLNEAETVLPMPENSADEGAAETLRERARLADLTSYAYGFGALSFGSDTGENTAVEPLDRLETRRNIVKDFYGDEPTSRLIRGEFPLPTHKESKTYLETSLQKNFTAAVEALADESLSLEEVRKVEQDLGAALTGETQAKFLSIAAFLKEDKFGAIDWDEVQVEGANRELPKSETDTTRILLEKTIPMKRENKPLPAMVEYEETGEVQPTKDLLKERRKKMTARKPKAAAPVEAAAVLPPKTREEMPEGMMSPARNTVVSLEEQAARDKAYISPAAKAEAELPAPGIELTEMTPEEVATAKANAAQARKASKRTATYSPAPLTEKITIPQVGPRTIKEQLASISPEKYEEDSARAAYRANVGFTAGKMKRIAEANPSAEIPPAPSLEKRAEAAQEAAELKKVRAKNRRPEPAPERTKAPSVTSSDAGPTYTPPTVPQKKKPGVAMRFWNWFTGAIEAAEAPLDEPTPERH